MTNPTHRERDIFERALEISSADERLSYLRQTCGADANLFARVEALLRAHEQAAGFLPEHPLNELTLTSSALAETSGDRIGRYKLLEKIGEGGFGDVWMAEQSEPIRRRVALKIIKLGMDTREVVARFEAERQALALMDHPNIAHIYDGGATDTGRPYFVMELVRGTPITKYCDNQRLSIRERLELFTQVFQAVQHAHQKGIVHRDLKPSNILVAIQDDRPLAKVIDFGVAKATETRLTDKTLFTRCQQIIGTPAYMSPEQARLGSLEIDGRSDIYSLGVLLYELLTGCTPLDPKRLAEQGCDPLRAIRDIDPPSPSARLNMLTSEELHDIAIKRSAAPENLSRFIRGDLDCIVMKCIDKDPTRRYESVNALSMDVRRLLAQQPIIARPPSHLHRFQKLVRCNRFVVAAGATAAASIALAAVLWPWPVWNARDSTQAANAHETPRHSPTGALLAVPANAASLPAGEVLQIAYTGNPPPSTAPVRNPQLQFEILAKRQGEAEFAPLNDGGILRSEVDEYRLEARSMTAGYLYVFQVDSLGKKDWLFPANLSSAYSSGTNPVPAGQVISIPAQGQGSLYLDKHTGLEHVYAVFSAMPWPELEHALQKPFTGMASTLPQINEPLGFRVRGVGGIRPRKSHTDVTSEDARTNDTQVQLGIASSESFEGVLAVERWFRHVD